MTELVDGTDLVFLQLLFEDGLNRCEAGFRSGYMLCHSITFTLRFLNQVVVIMLEYCPVSEMS